MTTDVLAAVRHLIGTRYAEDVKGLILEATGLRIAVGPNDITTMDIRTDRVIIKVDAEGLIEDLRVA